MIGIAFHRERRTVAPCRASKFSLLVSVIRNALIIFRGGQLIARYAIGTGNESIVEAGAVRCGIVCMLRERY